MSNLSLSKICFGCEALGGTDWGDVDISLVEEAILKAVDYGVTFFDTAAVYGLGLSEKRLSTILGSRRHNLYIATKGGMKWQQDSLKPRAKVFKDSSPQNIEKNVHDSLRRLKLDSIPIFYVHWPDKSTPYQKTFDTLNNLQEKQLIQSIGVSNFNFTELKQAQSHANIKYAQLPASIIEHAQLDSVLSLCLENSINVIAYNVLYSGLLTGKFDGTEIFPVNDRRSRLPFFQGEAFTKAVQKTVELKKIADTVGLALHEYAVSELLENKFVSSTIIGIKDIKQLESFHRFF
jgi:aryl-alcohol dehydrogenase-like predicted oxidoreductase